MVGFIAWTSFLLRTSLCEFWKYFSFAHSFWSFACLVPVPFLKPTGSLFVCFFDRCLLFYVFSSYCTYSCFFLLFSLYYSICFSPLWCWLPASIIWVFLLLLDLQQKLSTIGASGYSAYMHCRELMKLLQKLWWISCYPVNCPWTSEGLLLLFILLVLLCCSFSSTLCVFLLPSSWVLIWKSFFDFKEKFKPCPGVGMEISWFSLVMNHRVLIPCP